MCFGGRGCIRDSGARAERGAASAVIDREGVGLYNLVRAAWTAGVVEDESRVCGVMARAGQRWSAWALAGLVMLGVGCSSGSFVHVWEDRYQVARAQQDRGELGEARGHYAQLLKHAPDDERRRLIELELALLLLDEGREAEALAALDKIWEAKQRDAHGARAMWEAAELRQRAGEVERGSAMREALITRYPGHVWADLAMFELRREYVAAGRGEELCAKLTAMLPAVRGSGMSTQLLFARAEVERDALEAPERALATFLEVATLDPGGSLADDAVWERAEIYRAGARWKEAVAELGKLADPAESSWFVGSYDLEYSDQARLDRGVILLEHMDDWRGARREFERFLSDYEDSLLRDDAAWGIVRATWAGEGEQAGKQAMGKFVEAYPESRYVRRAVAIREGREVAP
jgi:tetratricopeptide (TPR) repeat protein